ncbi:hypothetical protein M758_7G063900 [Ceratodon purpureus]|uniref:Uncharacterized protein n=1 Tax=Ceratodon purpureus TaxID=3225 RepID=A0A8T0HC46_CERPU|nr:hypothetical protein KC19_7G080400 [Ceratodon purpureus]KAG0610422.1 hypothetical protein M758_7G063900 [Ceratodon purpureus]
MRSRLLGIGLFGWCFQSPVMTCLNHTERRVDVWVGMQCTTLIGSKPAVSATGL